MPVKRLLCLLSSLLLLALLCLPAAGGPGAARNQRAQRNFDGVFHRENSL